MGARHRDRRQFLSTLVKVSGAIAAPLTLHSPSWAQTDIASSLNAAAAPSTAVGVVNILATVRNKKNEIVQGLTKDDFVLQEAGRLQEIRYLRPQAEIPLTVGLVIDFPLMISRLKEVKASTQEFLSHILRQQDNGFLATFGTGVWLNQPLTSSSADLERTISAFKWNGHRWPVGYPEPPKAALFDAKLFDAIVLASDAVMLSQRGRKAIIVLSNGDDVHSVNSIARAIASAQRAEALVYTMQLSIGSRKGTDVWKTIAQETGGLHFPFSHKPLRNAFGEIEDELRNQYSLGFEPEDKTPEFHSIRLTTRNADFKVQARTRYYLE